VQGRDVDSRGGSDVASSEPFEPETRDVLVRSRDEILAAIHGRRLAGLLHSGHLGGQRITQSVD